MSLGHLATARALIGRSWGHRGRGPYRFDCVGMLKVAITANGRDVDDFLLYDREPNGDQLRQELRKRFGPPERLPAVGRIGLFRGKHYPLHVGFIGDYRFGGLSLIHASNEPTVRKVTECQFAGEWSRRFIEAYEVPCGP